MQHFSWVPQSLNLTPLDFFLLKHVKVNVYKTTIKYLDDIKIRIIEKIEAIKKETLHNVFLEIENTLNFCISVKDNSFKKYL
jgi:hypothetical protein